MTRHRVLPLHRWSLVRRFTALALSLTLGIGVVVTLVADLTLQHTALDAEAETVARAAQARLVPFLTPADLTGPLTADRRAELDRRVRDTGLEDPDRVGVVLWNRDRRVVWSSDPAAVGRTATDAEELAAALGGRLMRESKSPGSTEIRLDRTGLESVIEVYVPLRLSTGGPVLGVFEIYHDARASDRRVATAEKAILVVLGLGLGVLLLVLLTVVRDASRQLQAQARELARVAARAEADRLQTEFVAVVSHELRTPLTGMVGFSELLLDEDVDPDDRRHWTRLLHSGAERLRHLVEELLDVTRLQAGRLPVELRAVDVAEVVTRAAQTFEVLPEGLELVTAVRSGDVPAVRADPERLVQVLTNVVSNAVKYSPGGGRVVVDALADGDRVRIRVRDEGLGIPAEELPGLFRRFHRIQDESRRGIDGSGLGLWIAHELVTLQGGTMHVTSPGPGLGTTVTVDLAAQATAPAGPVAATQAGRVPAGPTAREATGAGARR